MKNYVIFFGKSQSFRFEAYDVEGHIEDFSSIIPDFEDLESRTVVVRRLDNKPVYAYYKLKSGNKNYSLFKVYKCAQAFDGDRIEGSICGVALLSESCLNIDEKNLSNLNALFKSFTDLTLLNQKFKIVDFESITENIWKAFSEQVSYSNISLSNTNIKVGTNNTIAISLQNISEIFTIQQLFSLSDIQRLYFSVDKELLISSYKRWSDRMRLYLFVNGHIEPYSQDKDSDDVNKKNKPPIENSQNLHAKIHELEVQQRKEQKNYQKKLGEARNKFNLLLLIAILFTSSLVIYILYSQFFSEDPKPYDPTVKISPENGYVTNIDSTISGSSHANNANNSNSYIPLEIFSDTNQVKNLDNILVLYLQLNRIKKKDTARIKKGKIELIKKIQTIKTIDSNDFKNYLPFK